MAGFLFGADTGVSSAQELAKRREIVNALLDPSMVMPQTFGEGLTVFGRAIAGRLKDKKLAKEEAAERARVSGQFDAVTGALMGGQGGAPRQGAAPRSSAPRDPLAPINIAGDTMAALGKDAGTEGYRASLIGTESGGNWAAANNETGAGGKKGHFGRLQFGHARLQEAMDAGAIPQGTTPEQFMASPALQIAAENWHFADLESKLGDLVGRTVNGKPLDMAALVAMGHLGGASGARKFVESGGAYNPSDSFGTSLAEYAATHGGTGSPGQTTMSASGPGMGDVAALSEMASNPYLPEGQRAVVNALLTQAMTPPDPLAEIELQKAHLELAQMQNPTPEPGFRTLTADEVAQMGLPPGAYQMGADGKISQIGGGGTNVTVNNGGLNVEPLGTEGQILVPDPTQPSGFRVEVAPGSKLDQERKDAAEGDANKDRQGALKLGTSLTSIGLNLAEIEDGGLPVTGAIGDLRRTGVGRFFTGDDAVDFGNRTSQVTDSAAFAEIQNMRDNSPTGGAVGQLTDAERTAIGNAVTALNNSTSAEEYARAATAYRALALDKAFGEGTWTILPNGQVEVRRQDGGTEVLGDPVAGAAAAKTRAAPAPADLPPAPAGIDPEDWKFMTPEERALFQ